MYAFITAVVDWLPSVRKKSQIVMLSLIARVLNCLLFLVLLVLIVFIRHNGLRSFGALFRLLLLGLVFLLYECVRMLVESILFAISEITGLRRSRVERGFAS